MRFVLCCFTALFACATTQATELPRLPIAVSNNAVASVTLDDGVHLISSMGLHAGKTWRDTTSATWHLPPGATQWRSLPEVPGGVGRLASIAVGVAKLIYIFGGYTVAEDHSEVSVPLVHALDVRTGEYAARSAMPIPVDDSVALVYQDRYIYLVSGWHDYGNVNLVQLYDTQTDTWQQATPWPVASLFGHAGGIVGRDIVICDGVKIKTTRGKREFTAADQCLLGTIRADDPRRIDWSVIADHPGAPRYRMAATGTVIDDKPVVIFAGGSDNPYNYDGIGYDGRPSKASASVYGWFTQDKRWRRLAKMSTATMDHRGLLQYKQHYVIIGGMRNSQQVSADVLMYQP